MVGVVGSNPIAPTKTIAYGDFFGICLERREVP